MRLAPLLRPLPRYHLAKPERRRRLLSQVACSWEKRAEYRIHGKKEYLLWRGALFLPSFVHSFVPSFLPSSFLRSFN